MKLADEMSGLPLVSRNEATVDKQNGVSAVLVNMLEYVIFYIYALNSVGY